MIQRVCCWKTAHSLAQIVAHAPRDVNQFRQILSDPNCWAQASPTTMLNVLDLVAEWQMDSKDFAAHAARSIGAILPSLSREEVFRVASAFNRLDIRIPADLSDAVDNLVSDSDTNDHSKLEVELGVLSMESCCRMLCRLDDEKASADILSHVLRRLSTLLRGDVLSVEHADRLLGIENVKPVRNIVINALHHQIPKMPFSDILQLMGVVTVRCSKKMPFLLFSEALRRAESLVSPETEAQDLLKLLSFPHRMNTKAAVFASIDCHVKIADLDVYETCELLTHIVDAVEKDWTVSTSLTELVCARLYLDVALLTAKECCCILEDLAVLADHGCSVSSAFEQRVKRHFFSAFRDEYGPKCPRYDRPLEFLIRFVRCCRRCSVDSLPQDAHSLIALQRECMSCPWRVGPLLNDVAELLRSMDALHLPFATA